MIANTLEATHTARKGAWSAQQHHEGPMSWVPPGTPESETDSRRMSAALPQPLPHRQESPVHTHRGYLADIYRNERLAAQTRFPACLDSV